MKKDNKSIMTERELDLLATKVVAKFSQLRELITYHDKLYNMTQVDWD